MKSIAPLLFFTSFLIAGYSYAETVYVDCQSSKCEKEHDLGHDKTKEFRGNCYADKLPNTEKCHPENKNVTCTTTETMSGYKSCSCTNWSATGNHKMKLEITCSD